VASSSTCPKQILSFKDSLTKPPMTSSDKDGPDQRKPRQRPSTVSARKTDSTGFVPNVKRDIAESAREVREGSGDEVPGGGSSGGSAGRHADPAAIPSSLVSNRNPPISPSGTIADSKWTYIFIVRRS